ncbi:hypothetical protein GCM10017782_04980 [Deinococcus ficus]|nr:hypothetical protein GCM10017782_04980 [Deinococcus ficus]
MGEGLVVGQVVDGDDFDTARFQNAEHEAADASETVNTYFHGNLQSLRAAPGWGGRLSWPSVRRNPQLGFVSGGHQSGTAGARPPNPRGARRDTRHLSCRT